MGRHTSCHFYLNTEEDATEGTIREVSRQNYILCLLKFFLPSLWRRVAADSQHLGLTEEVPLRRRVVTTTRTNTFRVLTQRHL